VTTRRVSEPRTRFIPSLVFSSCRLCFPFSQLNLLQLVISAFVAAEQFRPLLPLLHHCVVVFFWSSGITDSMLFTFENRVPLMRLGASVVWHLSFPLIDSFNKTEAAFFPHAGCAS